MRLLLHFGEVETRDGSPAGPTVEKAFEILKQIEAGKLYLTEAFVKKSKVAVRLRDAGARAGVKLQQQPSRWPSSAVLSVSFSAEPGGQVRRVKKAATAAEYDHGGQKPVERMFARLPVRGAMRAVIWSPAAGHYPLKGS